MSIQDAVFPQPAWFDRSFSKAKGLILADLRALAAEVCVLHGLRDVEAPLTVANALACELGRGDGSGLFFTRLTGGHVEAMTTVATKVASKLSKVYAEAFPASSHPHFVQKVVDRLGFQPMGYTPKVTGTFTPMA